jgi:hypothetical protein
MGTDTDCHGWTIFEDKPLSSQGVGKLESKSVALLTDPLVCRRHANSAALFRCSRPFVDFLKEEE